MRTLAILLVALVLAAPFARAGTKENPEVTDAAGDCAFAPGNHYMDITSAWISDETATDFNVNIALAEWVAPAAEGAGYALEFTHQKMRFGVIAGYFAQSWGFGNGDALGDNFTFYSANGSFSSSPPVITVKFEKHYFPHKDMSDDMLVDFVGGSTDFKGDEPFFFAPAPVPTSALPPPLACDSVKSDKTYTFQAGMHSMSGMNMSAEGHGQSQGQGQGANATLPTPVSVVPAATKDGAKATPFPAPVLALALVVAVALVAKRRRG